ncbi:MAG: hypothetical protein ACP5OG_00410 [Candidatus Nanoarchaeia archaeon]
MDIDLTIKLEKLVLENQGNKIGVNLSEEEFIDILNSGEVEKKDLNRPAKFRTKNGYVPGFLHQVSYRGTIFSTGTYLAIKSIEDI